MGIIAIKFQKYGTSFVSNVSMSRMIKMSISMALAAVVSSSVANTREAIQSLDPKLQENQRHCLNGNSDRSERETATKISPLAKESTSRLSNINRIRK